MFLTIWRSLWKLVKTFNKTTMSDNRPQQQASGINETQQISGNPLEGAVGPPEQQKTKILYNSI